MKHKRGPLLCLMMLGLLSLIGCRQQSDRDKAQEALTDYFALLNQGEYMKAAELYGGTYDVLTDWNPTVDPTDYPKLWEMGCTTNGLQCLQIQSIGAIEDSAPDTFEFYIQFENPDGTVFEQESLDGSPSESTFKFTVVKQEDGFVVQELPVYVP